MEGSTRHIRSTYSRSFKYLVLVLLLVCVTGENSWNRGIPISTNILDFVLSYLGLLLLYSVSKRSNHSIFDQGTNRLISIYFIWFIFTWFRGFFMAVDYFSYRNLFFLLPITLFPLFFYTFSEPQRLGFFLQKWVKVCLPLFVVLAFMISRGAYGFYLSPITILLIFLFDIKPRWRLLLILVALFVIFSNLSARSNIIKIVVAFLLAFAYFFKSIISARLLKSAGILFVVLPYLLISFAAFDGMNILQDLANSGNNRVLEHNGDVEESVFEDTRSFIYYEVIESAIDNDYVLWGRTPARGNDTKTVLFNELNEDHNRKVQERFANEIGAANAFTHFGLIGLIIFLLIYYRSAYLALCKSNSYYMKLIGLFICFRSFFFFLEDYYSFRIQAFTLIFLIGMGFSTKFREMTDNDFKVWINGILK